MPEQIVLAFDYGTKRIGVALGYAMLGSARPLNTLHVRADAVIPWDDIDALIKEWRVTHLLVGIPLNMDGTSQTITKAAKRFAAGLGKRFALPVDEVDERLSTVEARQRLFEVGGYRKIQQSQVDSVAATILLEQWLRSHA